MEQGRKKRQVNKNLVYKVTLQINKEKMDYSINILSWSWLLNINVCICLSTNIYIYIYLYVFIYIDLDLGLDSYHVYNIYGYTTLYTKCLQVKWKKN